MKNPKSDISGNGSRKKDVMNTKNIFFTTRKAATLLGVCVGTTQQWVDKGFTADPTGNAGASRLKVLVVEDTP